MIHRDAMAHINTSLGHSSRLFDALFGRWEGPGLQRWLANLLVIVFIGSLLLIEANRQQLLPTSLESLLPVNHFYAVRLAFDLLLLIEVLGLVFSLAGSVANSMGKQFEILSLILLRQSFKEVVHFNEPITWEHVSASVPHILSDAGGALVIFLLVGVFYRMQRHRSITSRADDLASFVATKKIIALLLLATFIGIAVDDLWRWLSGGHLFAFFDVFYTVLVFSDILIVLISVRYSSTYSIVFRNSGFAVATVLIRLALAAPPYANVLLGIAAVALGVGLTFAYNFAPGTPRAVESSTFGVADKNLRPETSESA